MNSSYGGGKGRRRQSKDHHSRVVPVVDDPDIPHSSYPPHHSQSYTPPHDMRRESSHSRTRRAEVDNWQQRGETSHSVHDNRYNHSNHNESHRQGRGSREIYERQDHGDVDAWQPRPRNDHYASSSRDWVDDYAYPSSSYNEPSYSTAIPSRSSGYDWAVEDDHRLQENGHRYGDEPSARGWGREPPRDNGGVQPRFVSDSGWDTRLADRGYVDDPRGEDSRKWEPAPTWNQTANRQNNNRNQRNQQHTTTNGNSNNRNNKNGKGKKQWNKNHKNNDRNNRDWKAADDSHLNNWTKRDNQGPSSVNRIPLKRRQPRSRSRSRSHSPAASFYSRRSGRSRSRSPSPKRMRQSASPFRQTSSPVNQKRQKRSKRRNRNSPQAVRDRGRARQRTASPASRSSRSVSSASSRSSKDVDRPRTVHRLPTATSIKDIDISLSMSKVPVSRTPRKNSHGSSQPQPQPASPMWDDPGPVYSRAENHSFSSSMPPPPVPYSASTSEFPPHQYQNSIPDFVPPKGNRSKNAGFRPIGQNSSSLRKFFPGDEDEEPIDPPTPRTRPATLHDDDQPEFPEPVSADGDAANMSLSTTPVQDPPHGEFFQEESVDPRLVKDPRRAKATNGHTRSDLTNADTYEPSSRRRNDLYSIMSQVGEGTFGKVYKARNTSTGLFVALKRVRMEAERDGFPVTAMREIKLLQSLQHPNVVCLHEMMVSNGSVYMVFEYMDHDLTGILSQTQFSFTDAQLKSLCHQMLAGLAYLHHKGVIHRDIKGSNILVNNRGELKLADFGLARFYQKRRQSDYTNRVITLWYRPPELLFGTTVYGPEVDMWSAGCIMLELFTKKPVFQGNDEIHQLDVMYKVLGTPTSERWPGITELPWYELIKPKDAIASPFKDLFKKWLSPCGLQLAEQLLDYDPARRITAVQALQHPYFNQEDPPPEIPVGLSTLEGEWHELETKREKARKRKKEGSVH